MYSGSCHDYCLTCLGPTLHDCVDCSPNAHDLEGTCYCKPEWSGLNCEVYIGLCDPICPGSCSGPSINHCIGCV